VILIAIAFFGTFVGLIVCYGKQKAVEKFEYDMFYVWLKDCIENYEVHKINYVFLKMKLTELGQLKYKDKELTSILTVQFFRRFESFAKDEIDEHSPESVFGENDLY
jgi:hypothetical protein